MKRQHYMDNLRALLMLSGVMLHSALFLVPVSLFTGWPVRNTATSVGYFYLVLLVFAWFLPLFYTLAGYFSHHLLNKYGYWDFIKHRFLRIAVPFIIGFFILSIFNGLSFIAYYKSGLALNWHNVYTFFGFLGPLWFLYYLLLYYVIILILQISLKNFLQKIPLFSLPLLITLGILLQFLILWVFNNNIMDFPRSFTINPTFFFTYFIFYLYGWILSILPNKLTWITKWGWLMSIIGFLLIFPAYAMMLHASILQQYSFYFKLLMLLFESISTWCITLGILGIFSRWFNGFSAVLRYLTDASYWFYLTQVPIIAILQVYFSLLNLPEIFKLIYVFLFAVIIMGISYALFVRKTRIGMLLNGAR